MKLNVRAGDSVIVAGKAHRITQITEMNFEEKQQAQIPSQMIARRLTLDDRSELIFLG